MHLMEQGGGAPAPAVVRNRVVDDDGAVALIVR